MKTKNYLYASALLCGLVSLNACSEHESVNDGATTKEISVKDIEAREGVNADDAMLSNSSSHGHSHGFVYTQGNETGTNQIYIYEQQQAGDLTFFGKVPTGGSGNATPLGSQGAVTIDYDNRFLFAVNAGNNTISSFAIRDNGELTLLHNASSYGITPVSVAVRNGLMYVAHSGSSSITAFRVANDGSFLYIPQSTRKLSSSSAGVVQIGIAPNNKYIYVTERLTNKISKYRLAANGRPGARSSMTTSGNSPAGFDFAHNRYMITANSEMGAVNGSSATSYNGIETGNLSNVNGPQQNQQTGSGWTAATKHGYYAFMTNHGSNNISSYYVRPGGVINLITSEAFTGEGPREIEIAQDNIGVYVLSDDNTIHSYLRARFGNLQHTGKIQSLSPTSSGLATW